MKQHSSPLACPRARNWCACAAEGDRKVAGTGGWHTEWVIDWVTVVGQSVPTYDSSYNVIRDFIQGFRGLVIRYLVVNQSTEPFRHRSIVWESSRDMRAMKGYEFGFSQ